MLVFNHGPLNVKTETLCTWKSGDDGPLDNCEECQTPIPKGGDVHFMPDGGYSPDGTYVGACCLGLWTDPSDPRNN